MKFILDENIKHILNEKYLLNERYILTEATAEEVISAWNKKITDLIPEMIQILTEIENKIDISKENKNIIDKQDIEALNKAKDAVQTAKKLPGANEQVKVDLTNYRKVLVNTWKKLDAAMEDVDLNKAIETLDNTLNNSTKPWDSKAQKDALIKFTATYNAFTIFFNKWKKDNAIDINDITAQQVESLKKDCKESINILNDLNKYLVPDEATDASLQKYINKIREKDTGILAIFNLIISLKDKAANPGYYYKVINANIGKLKAILKEITTINTAYKQQKVQAVDDKAAADKALEDHDKFKNGWDERYRLLKKSGTADELNKFWEEYYKTEWGAQADAVKALGAVFVQEVTKIGFDPTINPLITFLKNRQSLLGTKINQSTWTAIHNAIVNHKLTLADIKGLGRFKQYNIVLNKNIFDFSSNEITTYLDLQQNVLTLGSNGSVTNAPWYSVFNSSPGTILANIMYISGDSESLTKDMSIDSASAVTDYKFRTIAQIKSIIEQHNLGDGSNMKATTELVKTIISNVNAQQDPKLTAQKLLVFLAIAWRQKNDSEISELLDSNSNFTSAKPNTMPNAAEQKLFIKWLITTDWPKALVKELLNALLDVAGWKA